MRDPDFGNQWRARDLDFNQRVDFACLITRDGGRRGHIETVFTEVIHGDANEQINPCLSLSHEEAQQIMNELFRLGFRAKDGVGTLAATNATEAHLRDMRAIVAMKLKVELL